MKVSEEFVVAEPPATLWEFFEQFDQVAQCVPGVEDVTVIDEDNSRVRLTQSLGPMTATFDVKMRVTARDPGKSMEFTAVGRSVRGAAGNVRSNHVLRLADEGGGSTRVFLEGDVALGGMLGSVGQKVVAKQAAVVTQSFAQALQDRLGGGAPPATEPDRDAQPSPPAGADAPGAVAPGAVATGAVAAGAAAGGADAAGSPPPLPEPSSGRAKVVRFAMAGAIVLALVAALRRLRSR
jgi:carbon monoxide dehydrogenase subunit G